MPEYITVDDSPEKPAQYRPTNGINPLPSGWHPNLVYMTNNGGPAASHRMLEPSAKKPGTTFSQPNRSTYSGGATPYALGKSSGSMSAASRPSTSYAPRHDRPAAILQPASRQPHTTGSTAYYNPSAQLPRPLQPSLASFSNTYDSYIKPQTAFTDLTPKSGTSTFRNAAGVDQKLYAPKDYVSGKNGISAPGLAKPEEEEGVETFDLNDAKITAQDYERFEGDHERHMRELLSGAIGDAEDAIEEGDDEVEGFSESVRLMPHQVVGVKWMRGREKARKYGGILADVS